MELDGSLTIIREFGELKEDDWRAGGNVQEEFALGESREPSRSTN